MARRRIDARRVKINYSYTTEEIAELLAVHKNTVGNWRKAGLPTIDDRKPLMVHGRALKAFLEARRAAAKR